MATLNAQGVGEVLSQPLDDDGVVVAPCVVGQVGPVVAGVDHEVEIPGSGDLDQSCARSPSFSDLNLILLNNEKIRVANDQIFGIVCPQN